MPNLAGQSIAVHRDPGRDLRALILAYLNSPQPAKTMPNWWWRDQFDRLGPFWAAITVTAYATDTAYANIDALTPLRFAPPTALYRAASERGKDGLVWTPTYTLAQLIANSRGKNTHIWKTKPAKVFGCIDITRIYPDDDNEPEQFTIWLTTPGETTPVDRWANPFSMAPEWAGRNVTRDEALATVTAWARYNPTSASPVENFDRDYWTQRFTKIGQFTFTVNDLRIAPTENLRPPTRLYRAATRNNRDGIAWTDSLPTAHTYRRHRHDEATIWEADAAHVYGRLNWTKRDEFEHDYTEWLIEPTNIRPLADTPNTPGGEP